MQENQNQEFIKLEHKKQARKLFFNFFKKHWIVYLLGFLSLSLTNSMMILNARILGFIIDLFEKKKIPTFMDKFFDNPKDAFLYLFLSMILAYILIMIGRIGWRWTLARQTHKAAYMLNEKIWDCCRFFKTKDLDRIFTKGYLMNSGTSDVGQARMLFGFTMVAIFDVITNVLFIPFAMLSVNVPITICTMGILIFLPVVIRKISEKEIKKYEVAQEELSKFNDLASQTISTMRLQRISQIGSFWLKKILVASGSYRLKRLSYVYNTLNYDLVMGGVKVISYIVIFFMGLYYIYKGSMSIGDFIALHGLIYIFYNVLEEMGYIIAEYNSNFTSLARLCKLFTWPIDNNLIKTVDGDEIDKTKNVLEINNLSFSYDDTSKNILSDFNLIIEKGDRLGITGPIGSGKSSIINILSGLERNIQGSVKFFGKSFNQYSHKKLRSIIGYIPQKPFIFADTIYNNVSMDRNLSEEEVWKYLKITCFEKEVRALEDGLYTFLGEWGINLSGGQKQRLSIARALARRPILLFLDDCLSAVDVETEEVILDQLNKELKDTTLIWIAHRKSSLKYCQKVLEL